jgi:hypothetical protein
LRQFCRRCGRFLFDVGDIIVNLSDTATNPFCPACVLARLRGREHGCARAGEVSGRYGRAGNRVTGSDVTDPIPGRQNSGNPILGMPVPGSTIICLT